MGKKHSQCVSIPKAFEELNKTLMMQSELKKREEIVVLLAGLGAFEIRKDEKKVHPCLDQPEDRRTGKPLPLVKKASKQKNIHL